MAAVPEQNPTTRIAITGANSAVGRVVVARALALPGMEVVACVRRAAAAAGLPPIAAGLGRVAQAAFDDPDALRRAFAGAAGVVHLPGILFEGGGRSYDSANVETVRAALAAARDAGAASFVLVSALGADPASSNPYLASKGQAERLVAESGLSYTVLRAPLVLACDSEGVRALARDCGRRFVLALGGARKLEQPLDARDLADGALRAAADPDCARDEVLELVGPESLPRHEILRRAGRLRGVAVRVLPIPVGLVRGVLGLRRGAGGFTPAVLDVLLMDDRCDPGPACRALDLELLPLDETLRRSLELAGCL